MKQFLLPPITIRVFSSKDLTHYVFCFYNSENIHDWDSVSILLCQILIGRRGIVPWSMEKSKNIFFITGI